MKSNTKNKTGRIFFYSEISYVDKSLFIASDQQIWKEFYPEAEEAIPANAPDPEGKLVKVRAYADADKTGNLLKRLSHNGIIIYIQNSPITWFSKRQNTVDTSSFGSEFIALNITTEITEYLRYKLRTLTVPIDGPADFFCDNKSVVIKLSVPGSVLSKKYNSICYHRVQEDQTEGNIWVGCIEGK